MKKPFFKIFLFITSLLLMLSVTACTGDPTENGEDEVFVVSITIDVSTVPTNAVAGQVNLSQIKVNALMSDDEEVVIPVTEEMIFITDRGKLNTKGTHQISVLYSGLRTKFWLTLQEPPLMQHKLTIIDGSLQGQDPIEGNWTGAIPSGQRVTIVALDKSDESLFFTEWTIGGQTYNKNASCEIDVDRDITVKANYSEFTYKVTFEPDGGTNVAQQVTSVIDECPITTKEEHVFVQWIEKDTLAKVSFPYTVTKDVTFKAVWESLGLKYVQRIGDTGYTITDYTYTGPRKTLVIPERHVEDGNDLLVTRIAKDAFKNAINLEEISLPKDLMEIEDYAFAECINLVKFTVDSENQYFYTDPDGNGVLYTDTKDKIIAYPAGKMLSYFNVENVSEVGVAAFYNANIGTINVRSTLNKIGDNAFNSRTIDSIVFSNKAQEDMPYSENIINDNIDKIYVIQSTHIDSYKTHPSFVRYQNKIEELKNDPVIGIYQDILYRIIDREMEGGVQSTLEIIGARRNITTLSIPIIPIEGKYITSIGSYALSYCYNLTNIDFPIQMKVDRILKGAFDNTKWQEQPEHNYIKDNLIIINGILFRSLDDRMECIIPPNVKTIAESSFSGMTKLQTVTFDLDGNQNRTITRIEDKAFQDCINLRNIIIPSTVKNLGKSVFENANLSNFEFEENSEITTIGDYCFKNVYGLTYFSIGAELEQLGVGIFNDCYSLEYISVAENNDYYISKDGVLYQFNKNLVNLTDEFGQILHTYPAGRLDDTYEIPLGVTHISIFAFYYPNIAAIVVPSSIENIAENSFTVPHLVYIEFNSSIPVSHHTTLFPQFMADYIIISDSDNMSNYLSWNIPDKIIYKSQMEQHDISIGIFQTIEGYDYLYRKDSQSQEVYILGGPRTVEELTIPSGVTIDEVQYEVYGVEGYAFMGSILKQITLPSTIRTIKAYAFYYSNSIEKIISYRLTAPTLEYQDDLQDQSVLSFNATTIIEKALIFVPAGQEQFYADLWPTTLDYILEIGTQPEIEFDSMGGSVAVLFDEQGNPLDLNALDIIPEGPFTTRLGYIFSGWYDNQATNGDKIVFPYTKTKKTILYAGWEVMSFEISYQLNGGQFVEEEPLNWVFYNEPYNLPVPVRSGYNFIGWADWTEKEYLYTDGEGEGLTAWTTISDEVIILIARWEEKFITVTFETAGGTTENLTASIKYNSEFELEVPQKDGYVFLRWQTEQGLIITDSDGKGLNNWTYTDEITLYAIWRPLTYTISFNDGQDSVIAPVTVTYGSDSYVFEVPIKQDSVFFGWFDGEGGTGTQYADKDGIGVKPWDIAQNVTLYAQWPIAISTVEELNSVKGNLGGSFILVNDLMLQEEWIPIGLIENVPFTGIFDGNGHYIYNISITSINDNYIGFIGYNKGIIRNLNLGINQSKTDRLSRSTISITDSLDASEIYVGGLVGYNHEDGQIINCKVAAEISLNIETNQTEIVYVGGIVGKNYGYIQDTYVVTEIESSAAQTIYEGTLAGYHANEGKIENCSYDRLISSSEAQTKACGNELQSTDFGSYDAIGSSALQEW